MELLGAYNDSGLREPPYLVRTPDGQLLQVSRLLYEVMAVLDGRNCAGEVAARVTASVGRALGADAVRFLVDEKLRPLGVVAGSRAAPGPPPALGSLAARRVVVGQHVVRRLAAGFRVLFVPPVTVVVLAAFVGFNGWLLLEQALGSLALEVASRPALLLLVLVLMVLSAAFHELGHAAAALYGGARPGSIGVGLFVVWPAFWNDVTDTYRLPRAGRLRADLGGIYFNAVFAVLLGLGYALTGMEALLLVAAVQPLSMLRQCLPLPGLDGYYAMSDLAGLPDLRRAGPIWRVVGGRPRRGVTQLTTRARRVVLAWLGCTTAGVVALCAVLAANASTLVLTYRDLVSGAAGAWARAAQSGDALGIVLGFVQAGVVAVPLVGVAVLVVGLCRRLPLHVATRRALRPAPAGPAPTGGSTGPSRVRSVLLVLSVVLLASSFLGVAAHRPPGRRLSLLPIRSRRRWCW